MSDDKNVKQELPNATEANQALYPAMAMAPNENRGAVDELLPRCAKLVCAIKKLRTTKINVK